MIITALQIMCMQEQSAIREAVQQLLTSLSRIHYNHVLSFPNLVSINVFFFFFYRKLGDQIRCVSFQRQVHL